MGGGGGGLLLQFANTGLAKVLQETGAFWWSHVSSIAKDLRYNPPSPNSQ